MVPTMKLSLAVLTTAVAAPALWLWPAGAATEVPEARSVEETAPVATSGDAADDPAIWVHPTDPDGWLVVANDKGGALEVYDSTGARVQRIALGSFVGNVDIRGDVVAVSADGVRFYRVDAVARRLVDITGAAVETAGEGLCLYDAGRSGVRDGLFVFTITRWEGRVRQYAIDEDSDGRLRGNATGREFSLGSEAEGCVAHDATGRLYVSEEDVAIWQYGADPEDSDARVVVDRVSERLPEDIEGLTIASGHLIASAQRFDLPWRSWFNVYDLQTNDFVRSVRVEDGDGSDDCDRTDGIAASADLELFVCQDNYNSSPGSVGHQNFKYVPLHNVLP